MKNFRKLGDHLLLDFCNTWIKHADHEEELLESGQDLSDWSKEFLNLKTELTARQFTQIKELRDHLRKHFERLVAGKIKVSADFISFLSHQPLHIEQAQTGTLSLQHASPLMGRLLESFYTFSQTLDPQRLKQCTNPNCSHLFYDISKNNRRQWCSMQSCGNVMKARAFYARKKLQKESHE